MLPYPNQNQEIRPAAPDDLLRGLLALPFARSCPLGTGDTAGGGVQIILVDGRGNTPSSGRVGGSSPSPPTTSTSFFPPARRCSFGPRAAIPSRGYPTAPPLWSTSRGSWRSGSLPGCSRRTRPFSQKAGLWCGRRCWPSWCWGRKAAR